MRERMDKWRSSATHNSLPLAELKHSASLSRCQQSILLHVVLVAWPRGIRLTPHWVRPSPHHFLPQIILILVVACHAFTHTFKGTHVAIWYFAPTIVSVERIFGIAINQHTERTV